MAANSQFAVAVHALTVLGYFDQEFITSEIVASSVNTNPVLIRRILASLKRAGLVKSKNGNKGGLKLALSLNKITLFDIYRGIQSDHFVAIHSNPENKKCPVSRQIKPILDGVLQSTEAAIDESLKRRTLADLIHEIKRREKI